MIKLENFKLLKIYRRFLMLGGGVYLLWWAIVEALLPGANNPLMSRLFVAAAFSGVLWLSYTSNWVRNHLQVLTVACFWLLTLHYYYLFYLNDGDINWIVGAFITVVALTFAMLNATYLVTYSIFVIVLSLAVVILLPDLKSSVFLPGVFTILVQSYFGLRSRLSLLSSVEARDEFISIASHELKTPISALKLQTRMIERDFIKRGSSAFGPEEFKAFIDVFNRQFDRLTELVETMLDVSRISAGRLSLIKSSTDLCSVVRDILAPYVMGGKKIILEGPDYLEVECDPIRIRQALENVIVNAVKYGDGKPITVKIESDPEWATITIQDQGIGIDPKALERIFERFERAISATHISGFGLGLYIARQIIETHKGSISAESQLGVGSTFKIKLPLSKK